MSARSMPSSSRVEGHRPVRVDLHVDAGGAARGRPPAAGEPLAAAGPGPAVGPADGRRRLHEALLQADAVEHLSRRALVALVDDVLQTELERIERERVGDDVHLRLDGEVRLRARRGPERAAVRLVGVDGESLEAEVRDPVGAREDEGGDRRDARARPGEGAGVEPDPTRLGGDAPVLRDAGPELHDGALTRIGRRQLLLARRDDLHRPAALPGEEGGDVLDADPQLAAEAAPDARHHHADLRGRDPEDLGERVLDLERELGVRPYRDLAGAVPRRHRRARLRVALMHHPGAEPVLEDAVGLLEAALHVAHDDPRAVTDVPLAVEDRHRGVALPCLVDQRRPRRQGRLEVQHRRERLVGHVDGGEGRLRRLRRGRRDGRHGLADVADLVAGKDRLVLERAPVAHVGDVGGGDDGAHARQRAGARGVEADDPGVRQRGAEHLAAEHPGQREVRGVDGRAADLAGRVHARERLADDTHRGSHRHHLP